VDNSAGYNRVTIKNGTILEFASGVYLASANRNRLSGLLVASNGLNGIELFDSHNNTIEENAAVANDEGIVVGESNGNRVDDNRSVRNEGEGIAVENASSNNRVTDNVSFRNEFGILVDSTGSLHNLIDGNTANQNGIPDPADPSMPPPQSGIYVGEATTVVRNNTANDNGAFGIEAFFGAIDGGGNKAAGNGEATECLNVVCT
jgi:parallel beta-helix repeat protein